MLLAFHGNRCLAFNYKKINGECGARKIDPLRLVIYQGRWYLMGYCYLRNGIRIFHLARAGRMEVCLEACESRQDDVEKYLQESFGIFKGEPVYNVRLLFRDAAADIVKNQLWHKDQGMEETSEGVILSLPVADFTEIKMKVLQYGWRARVLEPPELKREIAEEVRHMWEGLE